MAHYRSTVTMSALVVVFLAGTFIGFKLLTAPAPPLSAAGNGPTCEPRTIESGAKIGAGQITVNVYNASSRSGLATRTLNDLEDHGFRPGEVGNAPDSVTDVGNVAIVTNDKSSAPVRLVRKQFKGKVDIRKPSEKNDDGVRIVVGKQFKGVKKKAPTKVVAKKATEVCVRVEPTPEP